MSLLLSPLMLRMNSTISFTAITIAREFLLLTGVMKVAFHRIRYLVDVPRLPVLFEPVDFLARSKWWWSRRKYMYGGRWTIYPNIYFLVGMLLDELLGRLLVIGVSIILLSRISMISDLYTRDMKWWLMESVGYYFQL